MLLSTTDRGRISVRSLTKNEVTDVGLLIPTSKLTRDEGVSLHLLSEFPRARDGEGRFPLFREVSLSGLSRPVPSRPVPSCPVPSRAVDPGF